jgi:phosphoenolpyruvate carboxylase
LKRSQQLRARVEGRNLDEIYRAMVNLVGLRLEASLRENDALGLPGEFGGYAAPDELRRDLELMDRSLRDNRGERLAQGALSSLRCAAEAFGFDFVSLDVRQHEARHRHAVSELFCPVEGPFESLSLDRRQDFLEHLALMDGDQLPPDELLSADAREVIATLRGIKEAVDRGHDPIRDLVVSNAEDSSAVLELLVLARHAGLIRRLPDGGLESCVNLVPLFESVDALKRSADSMERLYGSSAYRAQLDARGRRQQIMLGYSDSAKDGGYLAAAFALQLAQWKLARQAREHGIQLEFFHGRGGAIGRGGGPTHRAILAQPPGTVSGRIKVTEQGEVIATKYGSVAQARHHLEQFLVATFEASLALEREMGHRPPKRIWIRAVEELADASRTAYRSLVYETPGFVDFFHSATPIDAISRLRIGSRPPRREWSRRIEDLRAIPWTFAWNQSRFLLSSWYGAGTAFAAYGSRPGDSRRPSLREIYQGWPFFRNVIDNLEHVLAKVDLHIAERYAALAEDVSQAEAILSRIRREYTLAARGVRAATGTPRLLAGDPELRRSLALRKPYLDALSYLQLELLRRCREGRATERLDAALQLTIGGVAAGLRNTG